MRADFSQSSLAGLATHYVGNKHTDSTFFHAEELTDISDMDLNSYLLYYFTTPFLEQQEYFEFHHETDISLNAVHHFCEKIFEDPEELLEHSTAIAKHLYEISDSPNIKSGELQLAHISNINLNGQNMDAIGIYKTENRDVFLQFEKQQTGYDIHLNEGIHTEKMDKGCIIYNTPEGLRISAIDKTNKRNEAQYWKDKFLKIIATADEFHHTSDYLNATKNFIVKQIPDEYEVTKAEQADFLNRSIKFFKENEEFNEEQFTQEVFQEKELITSFNHYKTAYQQNNEVDLNPEFPISEYAVKKSARVFKSVIKLDKNFHVYVHGNRELIEKGYDEEIGKHFYKIYFDEEK